MRSIRRSAIGRQLGDPDPIGEVGSDMRRDLEGEARLAHAARPGEREERRLRQPLLGSLDLAITPDERGELARKVVRKGVERPNRWEVGLQPRGHDLVQALGGRDAAQPVVTEVAETHLLGQG
jgi:hypothetical protein